MLLALFGLMVRSLFDEAKYSFEVCVEFRGQTHCARAAGATPEQAIRAGQSIGCTLLAQGRDENIACLARQPVSVRSITK